MIRFHRIFCDIVSKLVSQNYGKKWSVANYEKLGRDVCSFKHKVVNVFSSVCTYRLFTLKFHALDHLKMKNLGVWEYTCVELVAERTAQHNY